MIVDEKFGNALDATEELLLVPMPGHDTQVTGGFARQVFDAIPVVEEKLALNGGLYVCETLEVGVHEVGDIWVKPYTVVLAGLHRRAERGWEDAHSILGGVLAKIHERHPAETLAVAGTPGAGFSGLQGDVEFTKITEVMESSRVPIVIYDLRDTDDYEPLTLAAPLPGDHIAREEPSLSQAGVFINA